MVVQFLFVRSFVRSFVRVCVWVCVHCAHHATIPMHYHFTSKWSLFYGMPGGIEINFFLGPDTPHDQCRQDDVMTM